MLTNRLYRGICSGWNAILKTSIGTSCCTWIGTFSISRPGLSRTHWYSTTTPGSTAGRVNVFAFHFLRPALTSVFSRIVAASSSVSLPSARIVRPAIPRTLSGLENGISTVARSDRPFSV